MTSDDEPVPDHLRDRFRRRDDPVSEVTEEDARRRWHAYPELMWGSPVFGAAEEVDGRWRILHLDSLQPQDARDRLGSYFRRRYRDLPDGPACEAARAAYRAAVELLDWEPVDDLTVDGRRYRIIRAQSVLRTGPDGPEPPRPTDVDRRAPGGAGRDTSPMAGVVIDPAAGTSDSDWLLRMELGAAWYTDEDFPEEVRADSRQALASHPGVALLPVTFTVGEYVGDQWRPRSPLTYPTRQEARDAAAFHFTDLIPGEDATAEEVVEAYQRARAAYRPPRTDEFEVQGVRCRVIRVETFVRVGPDGPEGPRPSDRDPELPPERQAQQLRKRGRPADPD